MRSASISGYVMKSSSKVLPAASPLLGWLVAALMGFVAPALGLVLLVDAATAAPFALIGGPIMAVGVMAVGMIAAAITASLLIGIGLGLVTGATLILLAHVLGMAALSHPLSTGLVVIIASLSFAARGSLFARSAAGKGWWIAMFVVAGEVSVLATALAMPGALPDWLLALLPAQWASTAIQVALGGMAMRAANATLLALAGTAAATLLVASLLPRRWPYVIMFTTWLGFSALVWHHPVPLLP